MAPIAFATNKERQAWKQQEWRLLIWKDNLLAAVRAWAAQQNVVVHEGYSGGSLAV